MFVLIWLYFKLFSIGPDDKDQRVCVVAVIGKSDLGNHSCKAIPIDDLLKRNIFQVLRVLLILFIASLFLIMNMNISPFFLE